jgi:ABC-type transport system involved in cytochrome bd biosynthesis fused ATPase/permease subunit
VLHRGRVVEAGTHFELMARRGRYAELCRAQAHQGEGSDPEAMPWTSPSAN